MSKLTYLGHACFFFETRDAACLIDPWLSPSGAFMGTWRQLPPNYHRLPWLIEKMKSKPTIIYVTHEHEDHYDQETLRTILPYSKGLYIPRYHDPFFQHEIEKNLSVTPHLIDENVLREFHDISFKIFRDESGINRDSAIYIKSKDMSFLDVNDCKIYDRAKWLREQCGQIDIFSCQFSGANQHPICYELPEIEYKKTSRQKRMRKFVAVRQFLDILAPRFYVPSAGPAIFALPQHFDLNFESESIFPKWWEFRDYLQGKSVDIPFKPLDVGGCITGEGTSFQFEGLAQEFSNDDMKKMIQTYREIDAAHPPATLATTSQAIDFFEHEMREKIKVLKNNPKIKIQCPVFFDIEDPSGKSLVYKIDPNLNTLETTNEKAIVEPYYLHRTDTVTLAKFMQTGKGWGTYFLSFQFRNRRVPDVFDSALAVFLVSNDATDLDFGLKRLVEFRENTEYVTLLSPDGSRSVTCKRFCPHQGGDLAYAQFDGKYVVCPRHQWTFDCENGGKADRSADTIDATLSQRSSGSNNTDLG